MKKLLSIIIILCFGVISAKENSSPMGENDLFKRYKHTETKTIRKEFKVNETASLFVANKYGTITLITNENNKNSINFEVEIKVSSNNPSDVKERIKQIYVDFSNSGSNSVSAKTVIEDNSSFFKNFGRKKSISFQINYKITLPEKVKLSLENEYGNIFLNKTLSSLKIDADYGSINLGEILSDAYINLEYCQNSSIEQINKLNLDADYSGVSINKANYIKANCDYTAVKIGDVKELNANVSYNAIAVENLEKGDIIADYCGILVKEVSKSIYISCDYGSVKIGKVLPQANSVKIDTEYAGISVGYHPNWEFQYNFSNSYGKILMPESLPYTKKNIQMMESTIIGTKGNGKNIFNISSEYAGVKVYEN